MAGRNDAGWYKDLNTLIKCTMAIYIHYTKENEWTIHSSVIVILVLSDTNYFEPPVKSLQRLFTAFGWACSTSLRFQYALYNGKKSPTKPTE